MILLVDDEYESRTLLAAILTAEGYQVHAADGGELALASVSARRPQLILLDIRMPGMDGLEVFRRLKESSDTRDIPVIFLSASGQLAEKVQGLRLGAVDYIGKPFQREELLARVRTHVELARLRAGLERQVAERTAELQESEERFRTMADAAPVMIWVSGTDKLCTFFNKRWLEFTGQDMEGQLGNGWAQGVHSLDREHCYATYSSRFEGRQSFRIEYRLRRADGEYRWILDHGVPRFTSGNVFAGYIGTCVDITELKQNHERLLATQKLESLGVMAGGVAHDFGNLLGTIFSETELALSEMPPSSPGRDSVERIATLAIHATEIVRMLLDSAGSGVDPAALEPVDLSGLAEQMLRLLKISISKHAVVRTGLARDLPPVNGNVAQLRQVVMNLITNASEALEDRRGFIIVTTERVSFGAGNHTGDSAGLPDGEYARLTVSDTGCGMSPETRTRIFDQFFTTKARGRGLGLAAVHGIVRSHGGAINVVSTLGAGTTFELFFPCASQDENISHAIQAAGRTSG
jgi:PAS domain S-box-containing protein